MDPHLDGVIAPAGHASTGTAGRDLQLETLELELAARTGALEIQLRSDGVSRPIDRAALREAPSAVARALELAKTDGDFAAASEWALAEVSYSQALDLLPADNVHGRRAVQLERAKCKLFISQLPEANANLRSLVDELVADDDAEPELLADARRTLANSEYYMTWLMRLEGAAREEWEPRIEAARQSYKLLVQEAASNGSPEETQGLREDLESAIRLARMELTELQGLPLPSQ